MASTLLLVSQALVVGACTVLAVLLVVSGVRNGARSRWFPIAAVVILLVGTSLSALQVGLPWSGAIWFLAFPLIMAAYPDGRFVPRWSAIPVAAWAALSIAYVATGSGIADAPWWPIVASSAVALLGFQVYRYRRRLSTDEREQVRWGILGVVIEVTGFGILFLTTGEVGADGPLSIALANVVGWPIPVSLAVGLLRPRLVRVDPTLRAVVLGIATVGALAAVFGGVRWGLSLLGASEEAAGWVAALALALAVVPVLVAARAVADWLVYGGRASRSEAARTLAGALDSLSPADDVAGAVIAVVTEAIGSPRVRLLTRDHGDDHFAIRFRGEDLGWLAVEPRQTESSLTRRDREVVAVLASQAAPALHGARALTDLVGARASELFAREEERKRLRRDLHDDLAPTLAGLGLGASAITELAGDEQHELRRVASGLQHGVREAIAQTRQLARGLRPSILDDHGLVEAIRDRARVLERSGVDVSVTGGLSVAVPAAVEVSALLIAQEAIANVLKHAAAAHCVIRITADNEALVLRVDDDGRGIGTPAGDGLGLSSMRDRAAELGGLTSITVPPAGGTGVHVRLPLGEQTPGSES